MGREGLQWQFGQTWTCLAHAFLGSFAVFFSHISWIVPCLVFFLAQLSTFLSIFTSKVCSQFLLPFRLVLICPRVSTQQASSWHSDFVFSRNVDCLSCFTLHPRFCPRFYIPFTPTAIGTAIGGTAKVPTSQSWRPNFPSCGGSCRSVRRSWTWRCAKAEIWRTQRAQTCRGRLFFFGLFFVFVLFFIVAFVGVAFVALPCFAYLSIYLSFYLSI